MPEPASPDALDPPLTAPSTQCSGVAPAPFTCVHGVWAASSLNLTVHARLQQANISISGNVLAQPTLYVDSSSLVVTGSLTITAGAVLDVSGGAQTSITVGQLTRSTATPCSLWSSRARRRSMCSGALS